MLEGTCQQGNGQVEFVVVRDECGFRLAAQCDQQQGADSTMVFFFHFFTRLCLVLILKPHYPQIRVLVYVIICVKNHLDFF